MRRTSDESLSKVRHIENKVINSSKIYLPNIGNNQFGNEGQVVFGTFVTNNLKYQEIYLPVFGISSHKFRGPT
jgi:hypothetical protein